MTDLKDFILLNIIWATPNPYGIFTQIFLNVPLLLDSLPAPYKVS